MEVRYLCRKTSIRYIHIYITWGTHDLIRFYGRKVFSNDQLFVWEVQRDGKVKSHV